MFWGISGMTIKYLSLYDHIILEKLWGMIGMKITRCLNCRNLIEKNKDQYRTTITVWSICEGCV